MPQELQNLTVVAAIGGAEHLDGASRIEPMDFGEAEKGDRVGDARCSKIVGPGVPAADF